MDIFRVILTIFYVIVCIALVVVVVMQESKTEGLGAIGGNSSSDNSYWNKNKGRSIEGKLEMLTKIFAVMFVVISVILNMKW